MNSWNGIGRLTKDPEVRFIPTTGTATCTVTLAVDNYNSSTKEKGADFIPVTLYGKNAENVTNFMRKGSQLAVTGKIRTRTYEGSDGNKRYITEVVADKISFIGSKKNDSVNTNNDFDGMEPVDNGEMPF